MKQFAVIGIGRFGSSVAKTLSGLGFDVLAIDSDTSRIDNIKHLVTHAVQADATDEEVLKSLGLRNFDVAVVAIGQDIQSSILATIILKELGVPSIVVKAQNELHGKVLQKIGADKIVYPERDMGVRVAHNLISPNILDHIELSDDYSIVEIQALPEMFGKNLRQLDIRAKYGCSVMGIKNDNGMNIAPRAEDMIQEGDILVLVGSNEDIHSFEKKFSK